MVHADEFDRIEHLLHVVLERRAVLGELLVQRAQLVEILLVALAGEQVGIAILGAQRGEGVGALLRLRQRFDERAEGVHVDDAAARCELLQ